MNGKEIMRIQELRTNFAPLAAALLLFPLAAGANNGPSEVTVTTVQPGDTQRQAEADANSFSAPLYVGQQLR
jgi:predicted small lipoprotein YifL